MGPRSNVTTVTRFFAYMPECSLQLLHGSVSGPPIPVNARSPRMSSTVAFITVPKVVVLGIISTDPTIGKLSVGSKSGGSSL